LTSLVNVSRAKAVVEAVASTAVDLAVMAVVAMVVTVEEEDATKR
jgi:hypothetical protein